MPYSIIVVNQSTLVSHDDAAKIVDACAMQLKAHFCPAWDLLPPTVLYWADGSNVPRADWVVSILDNSTQAGALGYHSLDSSGRPDAFIFAKPVLDNAGVALYDASNPQNTTVASVLSHELMEMTLDVYANGWWIGPSVNDTKGNAYTMYAMEVADPVESDSYVIEIGPATALIPISVSNFITPAWSNPEATVADSPFDHMKRLTAPFSMSKGGYLIVGQAGNTTQVFGEEMPAWKVEQKKGEFARAARRK
jgi:hypothetical protein